MMVFFRKVGAVCIVVGKCREDGIGDHGSWIMDHSRVNKFALWRSLRKSLRPLRYSKKIAKSVYLNPYSHSSICHPLSSISYKPSLHFIHQNHQLNSIALCSVPVPVFFCAASELNSHPLEAPVQPQSFLTTKLCVCKKIFTLLF